MPRTTISTDGFYSLTEHDTEAAWVSFLTIGLNPRENEETKLKMAEVSQPDGYLYVCDNNVRTLAPASGVAQNTTKLFEPFPFRVTLANAAADRMQTVTLEFDNIDRTLVDVLRRAEYPMTLHYSLGMVLQVFYAPGSGNPIQNTTKARPTAKSEGLEMYVTGLELRNVTWNKDVISGTLAKDDIGNLAFPSNHPYYDHTNFPGLYGLSSP